jgi:hypothetical protein
MSAGSTHSAHQSNFLFLNDFLTHIRTSATLLSVSARGKARRTTLFAALRAAQRAEQTLWETKAFLTVCNPVIGHYPFAFYQNSH